MTVVIVALVIVGLAIFVIDGVCVGVIATAALLDARDRRRFRREVQHEISLLLAGDTREAG